MDWLNTFIAFWWCISLVLMWGWYFALRRYSRLLDERKRLLNEEERRIKRIRTLTLSEAKKALKQYQQEYPTAEELK